MTDEEILKAARAQDFEKCAIIPTKDVKIVTGYRVFCEENRCGNYNANYGCPPDCGTPEYMEEHFRSFDKVLVMQTNIEIDDPDDTSILKEIRSEHIRRGRECLKLLEKGGMELKDRVMMPGPCAWCAVCQKKNGKPCAFPEKKTSCASAYGVDMTALAETCHMRLDWDGSTISYFSMVLY